MRRALLIWWLIGMTSGAAIVAQDIAYISTEWNNSYRAWDLFDEDEEVIGHFRLKWDLSDDFDQWIVEWGGLTGEIRTQWRNDPSAWIMSADSRRIEARPIYRNDNSIWRIKDQNETYVLRYAYDGIWTIDGSEMIISTYTPMDVRDWVIDYNDDTIQSSTVLFIIFLAIHNSTPKE